MSKIDGRDDSAMDLDIRASTSTSEVEENAGQQAASGEFLSSWVFSENS